MAVDFLELMARQAATVPEGFTLNTAIQSLEDLLVAGGLTEEQTATLVGIGAIIYREGFRQFQSGVRTDMLLSKFKKD